MQESQLQDAIQANYEANTSTPVSTDDDYLLRRALINDAINRWEHDNGILWNELYATLSAAVDGTKTTSAGSSSAPETSYTAPSNFAFPGGFVEVGTIPSTTYYEVIPLEKVKLFSDSSTPFAYFKGNPGSGYTLVIHDPTLQSGLTINYPYYKSATTMSATTDKPEMQDPYFIVYTVVSKLHAQNNNLAMATYFLQQAEERLAQMETKNAMLSPYQTNRVEDLFDETEPATGFGN